MDTRHWYKTTDEPFFGGRLPQRFGDPSINQRSTLWKVSSMWQTCCALKWSKFHCYLRLPEGKSPPQKATSHMKREAAKYRVVYTPFPIPAMWLYYFTSNVSPQTHAHTHTQISCQTQVVVPACHLGSWIVDSMAVPSKHDPPDTPDQPGTESSAASRWEPSNLRSMGLAYLITFIDVWFFWDHAKYWNSILYMKIEIQDSLDVFDGVGLK